MMKFSQIVVLVVLAMAVSAFAADPNYQPIPSDANQVLASGIADMKGSGGIAYVEYWIWKGPADWYYYTYKIHSPEPNGFVPYIKHLTIGNPTGSQYIVTGKSGGGPAGGTAWNASVHLSLPTLVDWIATDPATVIYSGQSSWDSPLFQFASKLPPASASVTVREGSLNTYANGLIPAPGSQTATNPQSHGYWKHQYSGKGNRKEAGALPGYMNSIALYSQVFAPDLAGTVTQDIAAGAAILDIPDSSDMRAKARCQLFALWLNIVSQKLDFYTHIAYDPAAVTTTADTVSEAVEEIEAAILNPGSTLAQLENAKDMTEILNVM
jgi:hypothetical protein